jgi:hypothetical protein
VKHRGGRGPSSGTPDPGAGRWPAADSPRLVRRVFEALVPDTSRITMATTENASTGRPSDLCPSRASRRQEMGPASGGVRAHPPLRGGRGRLARIRDARREVATIDAETTSPTFSRTSAHLRTPAWPVAWGIRPAVIAARTSGIGRPARTEPARRSSP